jgi:hypothetical protein
MTSHNFIIRRASLVLLIASLGALTPALAPAGADSGPVVHRRGRGGDDGPGDDHGGGGGGGSRGRVRKEWRLSPTQAEAAQGLKGKARIESRADRGRQRVDVEVESRVHPAGTQLDVYFTSQASPEPLFLASLTLVPSGVPGRTRAEIELKNWDGGSLPAGATPVTQITGFQVRHPQSAEVLLTSSVSRTR